MADGVGIAPTQPGGSLGFRDRGITALPTIRNGQGDLNWKCRVQNAEWGQLRTECVEINSAFCTLNSAFEVAARVGLAPTPNGLTGRRATLTPPGNGTAGRISTCIIPLRRRMPRMFGHGSI